MTAGVEGITTWGWRPGLWRPYQEAFLVREHGAERPALQFMRTFRNSYANDVEPGSDLPEATALGIRA